MAETQSKDTLEARLLDNSGILVEEGVLSIAQMLLSDEMYKTRLNSQDYEFFSKQIRIIQKTATDALSLYQSAEKDIIFVHDVNNKLNVITGRAEFLLEDSIKKDYAKQLGPELYEELSIQARAIITAAMHTAELLGRLSSFYKARGERAEIVEASAVGQEESRYVILHVDDDSSVRDSLFEDLVHGSNIMPHQKLLPDPTGIFGHDGRRVGYSLHSYSSVDDALNGIHSLHSVDLLITDRKMPARDGYSLLDAISQPGYKQLGKPEFAHVKNIAMLTGGITPEEADKVMQTYGAEILPKPWHPLLLERSIYRIISRHQS